jgi:hypothetical protein
MRTRFARASRLAVTLAAVCLLTLAVCSCGPAMSVGDALGVLRTSSSESERVDATDVIAASLDASACAQVAGLASEDSSIERYAELMRVSLEDTLANDGDPARREAAARCLGALGPSESWTVLATAAAQDEDPIVRAASAGAVASVAGTEALTSLVDSMAGETEERVLDMEAETLAAMPGAMNAVLEKLGDFSLDTSQQVQVARVARFAGKDWVAKLCKELGGSNTAAAEIMLGEIGKPAVDPLIKLLKSKKSSVRFAAASALVRIENNVPGTVEKLTGALDSKSLKVIATNYAFFIKLGRSGTEKILRSALLKYGNKAMALDYLNCGNDKLDAAARAWASKHGYWVYTTPGSHSGPSWGEGL